MKKMISMITAAMLAVVFATGCADPKTCVEGNGKGKEACEAIKEGDVKCKWVMPAGKTEAKDGTCKADKADTNVVDTNADADKNDKKLCSDVAATAANDVACLAVALTKAATHGCKFVKNTDATKNKCEFAEGKTIRGHAKSLDADSVKCVAHAANASACTAETANLVNKRAVSGTAVVGDKKCDLVSGNCALANE